MATATSTEPTAAAETTAPAVETEASAPAPAAESTAESTPAPVAATEKPSAAGIIARITGQAETIKGLESSLESEQAAHAETRAKLESAEARLAEYAGLETALKEAEAAQAKAEATASQAAENAAATKAAAKAEAEESVAAKISEGVTDVVAGLGVDETDLPAATAQPDKPGQGGEFAHLKGRDKAAAAFSAQLSRA